MDGAPRARDVHARVAEVVLDVAVPLDVRRHEARLELAEHALERLLQDVGEHVEPPAVRHPDRDLLHAPIGRRASISVSSIGISVAAPSSEKRFCPGYLTLQELLERVGGEQTLEDAHAIRGRERHAPAAPLHAILEPVAAARDRGSPCTRRRACRE